MYHKWQSCDIWFLRYQLQQTIFFVILGVFLPFYPPNSPKNKNFKKMKKNPEDIIILHKCTKNHDHRLYYSWDVTRDKFNCYFSFWAIFCPFTPLRAWKIKFQKNEKSSWRYHHFTQMYQNSWPYTFLFLRYGMWQI